MDEADFSPHIGIIGGKGRMGRWLAAYLGQQGHEVLVTDACDGPLDLDMVGECRVLLLAVPLSEVEPVMQLIGPHTRADGVVIDIASLKQAPLKSMLAHARGEVIGCHPLFGPAVDSLQGQTVFLCPGRGERWLTWWHGLLEQGGARVQELDPAEHDRLMARVQSLRHLLLVGLGKTLMDLGYDPTTDLPNSGSWFQDLLKLMAQQTRQPPELYADLALNNPEGPLAMEALARSLGEISQLLAAGDQDGLLELMSGVWSYAQHIDIDK